MDLRTLQRIALDVAQVGPPQEVLQRIVGRLASEPAIALSRIWLLGPGDVCASCLRRPDCADQTRCLHLKASSGNSRTDSKFDGSNTQGRFRRFPLGFRKVGRIGTSGEAERW